MLVVDHSLPKGVLILVIDERIRVHTLEQVFVFDRQQKLALVKPQVFSKAGTDREKLFFLLEVFLRHLGINSADFTGIAKDIGED